MQHDNGLALAIVDEQKFFLVEPLNGYIPEVGMALAVLADARQRTMKYMDGLPPEAVDWDLAPNFPTMGSILYHIAAVEVNWVYGIVLQQDMPINLADWFPRTILDDRNDINPVRNISLDGHLYRLDKAHSVLLTAYQGMSLQDFRRVRDIPRMRVSPEMVLQQLVQHESEHRGQLITLRRAAETFFEQQRLGNLGLNGTGPLALPTSQAIPTLPPPIADPFRASYDQAPTPASRFDMEQPEDQRMTRNAGANTIGDGDNDVIDSTRPFPILPSMNDDDEPVGDFPLRSARSPSAQRAARALADELDDDGEARARARAAIDEYAARRNAFRGGAILRDEQEQDVPDEKRGVLGRFVDWLMGK